MGGRLRDPQAAIFPDEDLDRSSFRRNDPYFGHSQAGVVGEFFLALAEVVGRGEDFDEELGGGMDVPVLLDDGVQVEHG